MIKPFRYRIDNFAGGIDRSSDSHRIGVGKARYVSNTNPRDGVLKGSWGPGASVYTAPSYPSLLFYHQGLGWRTSTVLSYTGWMNWAVRDAASDRGAVSYVTSLDNTTGVPSAPRILEGATDNPMGLTQPMGSGATGGSGAPISFTYTFVQEDGSGGLLLESNPGPKVTTVTTVTATRTASTDPRVTHQYWYATQANDPSGSLYYIGKTPAATATFVLNLTNQDKARQLTWGEYGNAGNPFMLTDHSPLPYITCLPDKLHGGDVGADEGAGLLMWGADTLAGWCRSGQPQYSPLVNRFELPGTIQAIVSKGYTTYYFLPDSIWAASGQDDTSIVWSQTAAKMGCRPIQGRTVADTPLGVVFLSREGLALFDGSTVTLIDQAWATPGMWWDSTVWAAGYHDGIYYIGSGELGIIYCVHLQLPGMPVTVEETRATTFHTVPQGYSTTLNPPGQLETKLFFVAEGQLNGLTSLVRPLNPLSGANVAGATLQTPTYQSGYIDMGAPNQRKRARQMRLDGKGTVEVILMHDVDDPDALAPNAYHTEVTMPTTRPVTLPASVAGLNFTVRFRLKPGSELRAWEIEGAVG